VTVSDNRSPNNVTVADSASSARGARGLAPARHVLVNGLGVLTKETRTTPAVTIYAGCHAGTIYDPPDSAGLAHFVAKTVDRGTSSRAAGDIAEDLDNRGVSLSVAVNRHAMWLVCTCLAEDFEEILALVGDIVMHPVFPEPEVEIRRAEIVTLLRQDQDNPATVAMEALMRLLYGEAHPYGRRLRGTIEAAERVTRRDLQQFHASRFSPQEMSLALVGDIETDRALDVTGSVFGTWKRRETSTLVFPPVASAVSRRVEVIPMMNKSQADIACGFATVERRDPRYYAYWMMNNILGQYALGGRLGDSIREQQGMAYYTFSSLDASLAPGPLVVRAGVNPANVERAVASIDRELARMASAGPTDQEIAESRQYLIGSLPRTLETNVGIATFLQTSELFDLGLDYDERLPALLGAVTREQVHDVAREVLDPARATVVVAGPYSGSLQ
jgi:zinc protease